MLQPFGGETYVFEFDDTLWEFYIEEIATGKRYRFDLKQSDIDALNSLNSILPVTIVETGEEGWNEEFE